MKRLAPFLIYLLTSWSVLAQSRGVYRAPLQHTSTQPSLQRNPATGNYLLSYADDDGKAQTVAVEAADRVVFELGVNISADNAYTLLSYAYRLKNSAGRNSARIGSLILPCDDSSATATSTKWFADVAVVKLLSARKCEFLGSKRFRLATGAVLADAKVTARWLPGIAQAIVAGEVATPVWPSGEATPTAAYDLAETVKIAYLGGKKVEMLAPLKDPALFATPDRGVGLVLTDLSKACTLGWVPDAGSCNSLEVKLKHAQSAIAQNDLKLAGEHLKSLQNELSAQRGKQVGELAFQLLSTNVGFIHFHL